VQDDHLVALGRVTDAYGVKGWVKVQPYGGAIGSALLGARHWTLRRAPAPASPALDASLQIDGARRHSASVVAKPAGCDDRDAAEALKGAEVLVRRGDFPALPEGEFYWIDLVGCIVHDTQGAVLGRIEAIDDHGAHPILQLEGGMLIPLVDEYLVEMDPAGRRIVMDWQADWSA
jgi:16S rRNA processing protein RimM